MTRTSGGFSGPSGNRAVSQPVSPARSIPGGAFTGASLLPYRPDGMLPGSSEARGGRMARTQEPAVRRRLVAAATRLFAEKGYENASVSEIVAAAGGTKGSMYHYFQAKDDLLFEIYHRGLALPMDRLQRLAAGPGTPVDRLRAVAVDVVVTTVENLDDATVFFRSMHLLEPAKRTSVRGERRRYHERFRALIEEGQAAGLFRGDVAADL